MTICYTGKRECVTHIERKEEDRCQICGEHCCKDRFGYNVDDNGGAEFWVEADTSAVTRTQTEVFYRGRLIPGAMDSLGSYGGFSVTAHGDCGYNAELELA